MTGGPLGLVGTLKPNFMERPQALTQERGTLRPGECPVSA